jgi:hypothetical protein
MDDEKQELIRQFMLASLGSQYLIKQTEIKNLWPVMSANPILQHLVSSMEATLKNIDDQINILRQFDQI